jgi:hypothetical protein
VATVAIVVTAPSAVNAAKLIAKGY